jgi:hypothetical protein
MGGGVNDYMVIATVFRAPSLTRWGFLLSEGYVTEHIKVRKGDCDETSALNVFNIFLWV